MWPSSSLASGLSNVDQFFPLLVGKLNQNLRTRYRNLLGQRSGGGEKPWKNESHPNKWMKELHTVRIAWEATVQERENAMKFSNSEALGSSREVLAPARERRGWERATHGANVRGWT